MASIHRGVLAAVAAVLVISSCGTSEQITAATTCHDYLGFHDQERGAAVRAIGSDLGWGDAGSPFGVANLDSKCANASDATVGDAIGELAGSAGPAPDTSSPDSLSGDDEAAQGTVTVVLDYVGGQPGPSTVARVQEILQERFDDCRGDWLVGRRRRPRRHRRHPR